VWWEVVGVQDGDASLQGRGDHLLQRHFFVFAKDQKYSKKVE
jgi:hypothetical protein